ncbi:uncharacterized protein L199_004288 [Kwoniella botswanensis]|uniref:uncharacterized protein n=1 Tax=Kwoniella botswanensis TaxID=1268659 RepID=UPI00315DBD6F
MACQVSYSSLSMDNLHDQTRKVDIRIPDNYRKRSFSLSSLEMHRNQRSAKRLVPHLSSATRNPQIDTVEDGAFTPLTMIPWDISKVHIQIQQPRYPSFDSSKSMKLNHRSVATPVMKLSSYLSKLASGSAENDNAQPFLPGDRPNNGQDFRVVTPVDVAYEDGCSVLNSQNFDDPFPSKHYHSSEPTSSSHSSWTSSPSSTLNASRSESPRLSPSSSSMTPTGSDVRINSPKPPFSNATPITFGSGQNFSFTFTSPYPYPVSTASSIHTNPLTQSQSSSTTTTDSPRYIPRLKRARELISSVKSCKVRKISRYGQDVEMQLEDGDGRVKKMRKICYD